MRFVQPRISRLNNKKVAFLVIFSLNAYVFLIISEKTRQLGIAGGGLGTLLPLRPLGSAVHPDRNHERDESESDAKPGRQLGERRAVRGPARCLSPRCSTLREQVNTVLSICVCLYCLHLSCIV